MYGSMEESPPAEAPALRTNGTAHTTRWKSGRMRVGFPSGSWTRRRRPPVI